MLHLQLLSWMACWTVNPPEWAGRAVQMDATAMAAAMAAPAAAAAASAVLTATAQQAAGCGHGTATCNCSNQKSWQRLDPCCLAGCAFASFLCYLDRTNISTAIVPMAEQFGWSKQFCGSVLSAFLLGMEPHRSWEGSSQINMVAVLFCGMLGNLVAGNCPHPAAASAGTLAIAARFLLGVGQGVAFPAIHALLAGDPQAKTRSGAIGIIMACAHCGTALGFGASPGPDHHLCWVGCGRFTYLELLLCCGCPYGCS